MKAFVTIFAIVALASFASAAVVPEMIEEAKIDTGIVEDTVVIEESGQDQDTNANVPHTRQRRFTCDVFSFSSSVVTPNHTACALKCVGMGRKGGHCENNNCVCRNDKYIG